MQTTVTVVNLCPLKPVPLGFLINRLDIVDFVTKGFDGSKLSDVKSNASSGTSVDIQALLKMEKRNELST